jgi:hypothetical protein
VLFLLSACASGGAGGNYGIKNPTDEGEKFANMELRGDGTYSMTMGEQKMGAGTWKQEGQTIILMNEGELHSERDGHGQRPTPGSVWSATGVQGVSTGTMKLAFTPVRPLLLCGVAFFAMLPLQLPKK